MELSRVGGVLADRVLVGVVGPLAGVFHVVRVEAEPAEALEVVKDLPGHAGDRHAAHHAQDDQRRPGRHRSTGGALRTPATCSLSRERPASGIFRARARTFPVRLALCGRCSSERVATSKRSFRRAPRLSTEKTVGSSGVGSLLEIHAHEQGAVVGEDPPHLVQRDAGIGHDRGVRQITRSAAAIQQGSSSAPSDR